MNGSLIKLMALLSSCTFRTMPTASIHVLGSFAVFGVWARQLFESYGVAALIDMLRNRAHRGIRRMRYEVRSRTRLVYR